MHVSDAPEATLECGRHDDDRNFRTALAERVSDFSAELSCAEMVVEHGDVDVMQLGYGFVDRTGGGYFVSVAAQDSSAEQKMVFEVVEEKNSNGPGVGD